MGFFERLFAQGSAEPRCPQCDSVRLRIVSLDERNPASVRAVELLSQLDEAMSRREALLSLLAARFSPSSATYDKFASGVERAYGAVIANAEEYADYAERTNDEVVSKVQKRADEIEKGRYGAGFEFFRQAQEILRLGREEGKYPYHVYNSALSLRCETERLSCVLMARCEHDTGFFDTIIDSNKELLASLDDLGNSLEADVFSERRAVADEVKEQIRELSELAPYYD